MEDNAPQKVKTGVTGQPVSWLGEACALSAWLQDLVHPETWTPCAGAAF